MCGHDIKGGGRLRGKRVGFMVGRTTSFVSHTQAPSNTNGRVDIKGSIPKFLMNKENPNTSLEEIMHIKVRWFDAVGLICEFPHFFFFFSGSI